MRGPVLVGATVFALALLLAAGVLPFAVPLMTRYAFTHCFLPDAGVVCAINATALNWWWLALLPVCVLAGTAAACWVAMRRPAA